MIPKIKIEAPWYYHTFIALVLSIMLGVILTQALAQRANEIARNRDYVERTEREKVLLLEAITDVDSPQLITDENFYSIWSNAKFRSLLGKKKSELVGTSLIDILPKEVSDQLTKIVKTYKFKGSNPSISVEGYIQRDDVITPVLITFISVEKSWTPQNDGYFIFTILHEKTES
jgi:transcriptional regulator with PAS, ATPase and Fis domain